MNTVCISTKMTTPEKAGGDKTQGVSSTSKSRRDMSPCPPTDLRPCFWRKSYLRGHIIVITIYMLSLPHSSTTLHTLISKQPASIVHCILDYCNLL